MQCSKWLAELSARTSLGQSLGHNCVGRRVKCHSDMSSRNFHVNIRVHRHAIAPIHDAVVTCINGGLDYRLRNLTPERVQKIARALSGVAIGKYPATVLFEDPEPNRFCRAKNSPIGNRAADGRSKRSYRSYVFRPLARYRARDHSPQAVTDQMNLAPVSVNALSIVWFRRR